MSRLVLLVPVTGPLRVEQSKHPIDVEALLRVEDEREARYVDFGVKEGDEEIGRVSFLVIEGPAAINLRARPILAYLTGVHMVITGTAAFTGLSDERIQGILSGYP